MSSPIRSPEPAKAGGGGGRTRILLADKRQLVRDAIKALLDGLEANVNVVEAATFDEALARAADGESPDVIVVDQAAPGTNGLAGLTVMRERFPDVPVVVVSDASVSRAALVAGHGNGRRELSAYNPLLRLTRRERDVLALLRDGCSNKEIARDLRLKVPTVKYTLGRLYRKLGAENRSQAVDFALQLGWAP